MTAAGRRKRAFQNNMDFHALIKNKFTRDATKLAAWRSASHVERAPQREKTTPSITPAPAI
jgi:hypothetical protein